MEEIVYKKFYRKEDKHLNGKIKAHHGKRSHQKMKPYLVLQYLLRNTDNNNTKSAYQIMAYLEEYDIISDRRSIYHDIYEINKMNLVLEQDYTMEEAEEILANDELDEEKLIVYNKHKKGFYVAQPRFNFDDIRLLAECVYTAKFISQNKSKKLIDTVCKFVSEHQAEKIKHDAFLTDRLKTNNDRVYRNILDINKAMSTKIDGEPHKPEKISFNYLKYTIDDVSKQIDRRKGEKYIASPLQLLINDGNYYLLAFDDKSGKMRTYRVDRMKEIEPTGIPRDGEENLANVDLKTYTQRVFSMYGGEERNISLKFINPLLDTVIDRFGTRDVQYYKSDDKHFTISAKVEISNQFFGWLLGFGKRVQIVSPSDVKEQFVEYIDNIRKMY